MIKQKIKREPISSIRWRTSHTGYHTPAAVFRCLASQTSNAARALFQQLTLWSVEPLPREFPRLGETDFLAKGVHLHSVHYRTIRAAVAPAPPPPIRHYVEADGADKTAKMIEGIQANPCLWEKTNEYFNKNTKEKNLEWNCPILRTNTLVMETGM